VIEIAAIAQLQPSATQNISRFPGLEHRKIGSLTSGTEFPIESIVIDQTPLIVLLHTLLVHLFFTPDSIDLRGETSYLNNFTSPKNESNVKSFLNIDMKIPQTF